MDMEDYSNVLKVSGIPKEIAEKIWTKRADKAYLEMMMPRKEGRKWRLKYWN